MAHRPSALASVDKLLALADGQVQAFGPKAEVLARMVTQASVGAAPPETPAKPAPANGTKPARPNSIPGATPATTQAEAIHGRG